MYLTCDFERIVGWYFRLIFLGQQTQRILTNALQKEITANISEIENG